MTAINAPKDKYHAVWIIFFILGLGTLLPWNFFMTATMYFTDRLKDPSTISVNGTSERSVLESKFNNVMTLCAMLPLLIFTCLNSFIHQRIPQKLRISGSLAVIFLVFMLTAILVKVNMEPLPFFTLTMIKIICINSFGAVLQGSLFGLAGILPASYTTPIMSGQGLAGTFAAFSMICALASGSELQDSAFGYFITACVVILLAITSYFMLPKMEFFQYYIESNKSAPSPDEENKMDLLKKENQEEKQPGTNLIEEETSGSTSVFNIFTQIWVMALSVCFIFTVTIGMFPAVTVDVKSTIANGSSWETYFMPVSCFLLFNVMDWAGRSLTAVCMWPGKDSIWLPVLCGVRVIFIPLFMLCNVQPRNYLPVVFSHDAWYIFFMILFSFSNGYLASLCMCFGPKKVPQHQAETAGAIMAFFLSLGLALGAAASFATRFMV
ncbi:equilibrative nucleoside transporter 1-like [Cyprinodon tularosa]|uniref:Solute carrier family 29 member 1a n=1 Tax=Cyprinodon variegatus TaxID=28743 RepID=A0A3Q2EE49_CYPVA|nr:PREDICTED: equilibrative nucleoside transporter 1 [Cyprinodon variegatus]XP_015251094.1 PREDICTED: equilibrative nucleoside transporter 1 [Cyprinodon variegatus]XP_015251095.1 PREDICTED: equilibrative nucleoside transporter 1 [Cyprinodon variegatus]XP_038152053.1 equilibrative nucleoside transporter 1-like [Cyprinodon tularosa]XP_038152055.1 equilibrative nucleoside transporter 1-like [Cyprinodon tularosa]XP_038152056.1 equilibrative nucleoside transporter 1-like [Cyprinodon tularosa]XP_03